MHKSRLTMMGTVIALPLLMGACASQETTAILEKRVVELEERLNKAMQSANSARIDATTALHIVTKK